MSPRLPSLKPREVIRALERAGFVMARTSGSHQLLKHPERPDHTVAVPFHTKDLKRGTLTAIIKQAGFTVAEFVELL
jgi:predicted RNA binding protein YcfA (HicA-like mRNA interferase family)